MQFEYFSPFLSEKSISFTHFFLKKSSMRKRWHRVPTTDEISSTTDAISCQNWNQICSFILLCKTFWNCNDKGGECLAENAFKDSLAEVHFKLSWSTFQVVDPTCHVPSKTQNTTSSIAHRSKYPTCHKAWVKWRINLSWRK